MEEEVGTQNLIIQKVLLQVIKHLVATRGRIQGAAVREDEEAVITEVAPRPPEGARGVDIVHPPIRNPHHSINPVVVEEDQEEGVAGVEVDLEVVVGVEVDQEEGVAEVEVDQEGVVAGVEADQEVRRPGPNRM